MGSALAASQRMVTVVYPMPFVAIFKIVGCTLGIEKRQENQIERAIIKHQRNHPAYALISATNVYTCAIQEVVVG